MKRLLSNKKMIIVVAAILVVIVAAVGTVLLRGGVEAQEPPVEEPVAIEAPIQYQLGETSILAMPIGANVLVYEEEPVSLAQLALVAEKLSASESDASDAQPTEEDAEEEDASTAEEDDTAAAAAYRYEGWENAANIVSAYVSILTTEDMGYLYADDTLKETEEQPESDAASGEIYLIRRLPESEESEEKQAVAMRLQWETGTCTVALELVPASMTVRPKSTLAYTQMLTFSGAVETIRHMKPTVLELDGDSMEDYRVYSRDGLVLINGQSCMRIDIYKPDEQLGTNVKAGNYYLSADGLHLYLFNEEDQSVRELPLTIG